MKIIFCLPGRSYSNEFLKRWSETIFGMTKKGIEFKLVNSYTSNVYYVRNQCLGGQVLDGRDQKPFSGADYDYTMWIDSDILYRQEDLDRLFSVAEGYKNDLDIISGLYKMHDGEHYATVQNWDKDYFSKNGTFQFMTDKDINAMPKDQIAEVSYTGMGFILIRRGVFEKIGYPWFRPIFQEIGTAYDFTSEDVGFCLSAQEKGIKIWVDPTIRVGHEKTIPL